VLAVLAAMAGASATSAATGPKPPPWERMRFFLGSWVGEGQGQPGRSTVARDYALALGDRFIEVRNTSTYPPQEKNPRGEVHEDRGFISWDRARHRFVAARFMSRTVNQFVADTLGASDSVVFRKAMSIPQGIAETYGSSAPMRSSSVQTRRPGDFAVYSGHGSAGK
jgi:hypothetical protein